MSTNDKSNKQNSARRRPEIKAILKEKNAPIPITQFGKPVIKGILKKKNAPIPITQFGAPPPPAESEGRPPGGSEAFGSDPEATEEKSRRSAPPAFRPGRAAGRDEDAVDGTAKSHGTKGGLRSGKYASCNAAAARRQSAVEGGGGEDDRSGESESDVSRDYAEYMGCTDYTGYFDEEDDDDDGTYKSGHINSGSDSVCKDGRMVRFEDIQECADAFARTFFKVHKENPRNVMELWKSDDVILKAMLDGSFDVHYATNSCVLDEAVARFFCVVLPELCRNFTEYSIEQVNCCNIHPADRFNPLSLRRELRDVLQIGMVDIAKLTLTWYCVPRSIQLRNFLKDYGNALNVSTNSLRLEYNGKTVFMSDLGKITADEYGISDEGLIIVCPKPYTSTKERAPLKTLNDGNKLKPQRSKKKKKGKTKSKRKNAIQHAKTEEQLEEENANQCFRVWMDAIAGVHVDAEPVFKKKRQKLNEMKLERTAPKDRKKARESVPAPKPVNNPTSVSPRGKAGKASFFIRVGAVENLYKTARLSKTLSHYSRKSLITIDLHGYSKKEALLRLNQCLPKWVNTAMKGDYPWVISVEIVCGGGSQILSEVVETWIRQNKQVSNAPRNYS